MSPLIVAEILDPTPVLIVVSIVVAIFGVVGLGLTLRFLRSLRHELADELKREMRTQGDAQRVDIQQPLVITAHTEFATKEALERVKTEAHGRMSRERDEATARVEKLENKIDQNTSMTSEMRGEVRQINQNVSMLQSSLTNFMRDHLRT